MSALRVWSVSNENSPERAICIKYIDFGCSVLSVFFVFESKQSKPRRACTQRFVPDLSPTFNILDMSLSGQLHICASSEKRSGLGIAT
jgi:hypothetical protein